MKKGEIVFYPPGRGFWCWLVSRFSPKVTHVGVVYDVINDWSSGRKKGIDFYPIMYKRKFEIYRLKPEYEKQMDYDKAWAWATQPEIMNTKYDFIGAFAHAIRLRFLDSPYLYYCSEAVDKFFLEGGVDLLPNQMHLITPADLKASPRIERVAYQENE